MKNDYIIVIPARYKSSRLPGKPLLDILGKSMIRRVWEQSIKASSKDKVIVATDDKRIFNHCNKFNIKCMITSKKCKTGTDRVAEIAKKINSEIYINVQGDMPFIKPMLIRKIINYGLKNKNTIINGMSRIRNKEEFFSPHIPKVVTNSNNEMIYMSRAPIPSDKNLSFNKSMKQVCIYSFPKKSLFSFAAHKNKTPLEKIEDIEILRFQEIGYKIRFIQLNDQSIAIDTKRDYKNLLKTLSD